MFPSAVRPIAVEMGMAQSNPVLLRPIERLEFVQDTVSALECANELADHLFRECWAVPHVRRSEVIE
jgi:hypothetical protein